MYFSCSKKITVLPSNGIMGQLTRTTEDSIICDIISCEFALFRCLPPPKSTIRWIQKPTQHDLLNLDAEGLDAHRDACPGYLGSKSSSVHLESIRRRVFEDFSVDGELELSSVATPHSRLSLSIMSSHCRSLFFHVNVT